MSVIAYLKVCFSIPLIAVSMKCCIVIVLGIYLSTHLDPVTLTYISQNSGLPNFTLILELEEPFSAIVIA